MVLVAALMIGFVAGMSGAAATAQPDELPVSVAVGRDYSVVQNQLVGVDGCRLLLGDIDVGACSGVPLRGTMHVSATHPLGLQRLVCRRCRWAGPDGGDQSGSQVTVTTTTTGRATSRPGSGPTTIPRPSSKPSSAVPPPGFARQSPSSEDSAGRHEQQPTGTDIDIGMVAVVPASIDVWLFAIVLGLFAIALGLGWMLWRRFHSGNSSSPPDRSSPDSDGELSGIRRVRIGLSGPDDSTMDVQPDRPLLAGRRYRLWIDIGALSGQASAVPVQAVLFDSDPVRAGQLFAQRPLRSLSLDTAEIGRVGFELQTPSEPQRLRLRCNLYCAGALLQSFVVTVDVDVALAQRPGGWAYKRDYVSSFGLDPAVLGESKPYSTSILINHNPSGEHGVYVFCADRMVQLTGLIPAGQISWLQRRARALYTQVNDIGFERQDLPQALAALALHGLNVLTAIQPHIDPWVVDRGENPDLVWKSLLGPGRVQVVWPADCAQPLPVTLIYDYPLAEIPSSEFQLCAHFMADLEAHEPPRCLDGQCRSGSDRIVCPAGFWGFRLDIGCPLSLGPRPVPDRLAERPVPPALVLGRSRDPAFTLLDRHLIALRRRLTGVSWYETDQVATLLEQLRRLQPTLIYFYCHGGVDSEQGIGWIEIGDRDQLSSRRIPRDFARRWRSKPLVLLNGCSTAALCDNQANPLVNQLIWAGAAGCVGTEIDIIEAIACAFADCFIPLLLRGDHDFGEALRMTRIALLEQGTPAGLSYLGLAPADLRLV